MLAATPESAAARRLGTLAVGLVLVGAGVAMMIRGRLGVAPYDVLLAVGFVFVTAGVTAVMLAMSGYDAQRAKAAIDRASPGV